MYMNYTVNLMKNKNLCGESVTLVSTTQSSTVTTTFVKINGGPTDLIVDDIFVSAV